MNTYNRMRFLIIFLLVLFATTLDAAGRELDSIGSQCTGIWAAGGKSLYLGTDLMPTKIAAPDGGYSIHATSDELVLKGRNKKTSHINIVVNPPLMEVLWAPDSKTFVINVSDGGLVGTWEAYVYSIGVNGHLIYRNIYTMIKPSVNRFLQCEPGEEANYGVASWLNKGKDILLIVEVPPHSSCRNMGTIFGFHISVKSGKIIRRFSESELRTKWVNTLGCRFHKREEK